MNEQLTVTAERFREVFHGVRDEVAKVVVGQDRVITHLLGAVFAEGHVLLKGAPGLGRTLMVRALAEALGFEYGRIQFTPDLLPTDITGAEVLEHDRVMGERRFRFFKGPVFANMVLADEVNRSPARTQAALLEVMQEQQITVGGTTHYLPRPFTLIATQNTLDHQGVFALGEAQVDRFLMLIEQDYPSEPEEKKILDLTTGTYRGTITPITNPEEILAMQSLIRDVPVVPSVKAFAMAIVRGSRPEEDDAPPAVRENVRLGASPRATQALIRLGKVIALSRGRTHVSRTDIMEVARPVLAHRLLVNFRSQAQGRDYNYVLKELLADARSKGQPSPSFWSRSVLQLDSETAPGPRRLRLWRKNKGAATPDEEGGTSAA